MTANEWDDIAMYDCTECDFATSHADEADAHEAETSHRVDDDSA